VQDVRLAVEGKTPVKFFGRMGGIIPSPEDVLHQITGMFNSTQLKEKEEVLHVG
jgi:2-oxoglutarate ferredoxin oxidoreductase subunit alpha